MRRASSLLAVTAVSALVWAGPGCDRPAPRTPAEDAPSPGVAQDPALDADLTAVDEAPRPATVQPPPHPADADFDRAFAEATIHRRNGDLLAAIAVIEQALAAHPSHPRVPWLAALQFEFVAGEGDLKGALAIADATLPRLEPGADWSSAQPPALPTAARAVWAHVLGRMGTAWHRQWPGGAATVRSAGAAAFYDRALALDPAEPTRAALTRLRAALPDA